MSEIPTSHLPLRIEEITADWLTSVLGERYPGTVVTEAHIGTVIAGTATKVRLLLSYNEAGHGHRLPPTMWLKGGFIRHDYTYDKSFVNEAKFFGTWGLKLDINKPQAYWSGWDEGVQGLVLLEDLAARNATFGNASKAMISIDQQAQALELLASMHAKWWESPELKSLKNFSTAWEAAGDIVMQMLRPDYFEACINHRRCQAYVGPYRDRERIMAGPRAPRGRGGGVSPGFPAGGGRPGDPRPGGGGFFSPTGTGNGSWRACGPSGRAGAMCRRSSRMAMRILATCSSSPTASPATLTGNPGRKVRTCTTWPTRPLATSRSRTVVMPKRT